MERRLDRGVFFKCLIPLSLEVDRIGEDQTRQRAESARLEQVLDFLAGFLRDPGIDRLPSLVGVLGEICRSKFSIEVVPRQADEFREHRQSLLTP